MHSEAPKPTDGGRTTIPKCKKRVNGAGAIVIPLYSMVTIVIPLYSMVTIVIPLYSMVTKRYSL